MNLEGLRVVINMIKKCLKLQKICQILYENTEEETLFQSLSHCVITVFLHHGLIIRIQEAMSEPRKRR